MQAVTGHDKSWYVTTSKVWCLASDNTLSVLELASAHFIQWQTKTKQILYRSTSPNPLQNILLTDSCQQRCLINGAVGAAGPPHPQLCYFKIFQLFWIKNGWICPFQIFIAAYILFSLLENCVNQNPTKKCAALVWTVTQTCQEWVTKMTYQSLQNFSNCPATREWEIMLQKHRNRMSIVAIQIW